MFADVITKMTAAITRTNANAVRNAISYSYNVLVY
jgi:hypothetical protein